jgi:hypothetical protein
MTIANQPGEHPLKITWDQPDVTTFLDRETLRAHLATDGTALDLPIALYEQAAINWAENYMRRSIMAREHRWVLADFPRGYHRGDIRSMRAVNLPRGKTVRVNYIDYTLGGQALRFYGPSSGGSPPSTDFQEDLAGDMGGTIMPLRNRDWPAVDYDAINPVVISFRGGWETVEEVPASIKHAVMFAIDDMLEVRGVKDLTELQSLAAQGRTLEFRESLIGDYRIIRVY